MTESELKAIIADWLVAQNITFTFHVRGKMKYTSKHMKKGFPDIVGFLPKGHKRGSGLALLIEIKIPGGYISEEQMRIVEAGKASGAVSFFAYSLEDVLRELA